MPLTRISSASWWRDYLHSWAIKFAPPYLSHLCLPDFDSSTSVPAGSQGKVCPSYQPGKNSCIQICYFCTHSNVRPIFICHFCINSIPSRRQIWFVVCVWEKWWLTPPQKPRTPPLNISSFLKHGTRGENILIATVNWEQLDNSKLGSTQHMLTLTCCQDHILTENIWFVWSETSYSGDERRCYRCGTTNEQRTLKIELLSQWKLEAEFRN